MLTCGVDLGTSNTKSVLIDEDLNIIDKVNFPIEEKNLKTRVNPKSWLEQFHTPIKHFAQKHHLREKLLCSISTQGGSFALLDKNRKPIDEGFSWTGLAEVKYAEELKKIINPNEFYRKTGWEIDSWLMAIKLKQWANENKELRKRLHYIAQIPEFIFLSANKSFISDYTNTQISGLFDFNSCVYINEILGWIGINEAYLPKVCPTKEIRISDINIDGTKCDIIGSMHDQYATTIGAGISEDEVVLSVGTAWVINGISEKAIYDTKDFLIAPGRSTSEDRFGYISSLGQIGNSFRKIIERFNISLDQFHKYETDLRKVPPAKSKVVGDTRNGIIAENNPYAAIRRFMELSGFELKLRLERIETLTGKGISKILAMGGACKSRLWMEIIADICDVEVEVVDFSELAAYGAAKFAYSIHNGVKLDTIKNKITPKVSITPGQNKNIYSEWCKIQEREN